MQTHSTRQLLIKNSGALNDGFLAVNATQSTFRSLEIMYSCIHVLRKWDIF